MGDATRAMFEGAVAGAAATALMSAPMLVAGRAGAMGTQPPERVVEEALGRAGHDDASEEEQNLMATLAHLGMGSGSGALFALARRRLDLPVPTAAQGVAFGLAVWATSYKGWMPALGILPPAEDDRPGRRRTMVATHVLFGAALGVIEDRMVRRRHGR